MISELAGTFLEISACLHLTIMITIVNFSCIVIFFWLLFTSYWYVSLLYAAWWYYDRDTPYRAGRNSSIIRNFFLWRYFARYFPAKLYKTTDLDPSKNYLFAFHPHGLFVFGGLVNFATNATGFDELFPGLTIHFTVLNGQFTFPFYRDYIVAAGFTSGNPESIDYKLTKLGPGHSVWLAVGGAAEVLLIDSKSYTLKLKNRQGFVRRALKTGALLVPVFSFNEHRLYDLTLPEKGSAAYYLQKVVKFISKLTLPIDIRGRSWCWYFLPHRRPINTVVGAPIDFAKLKSFQVGMDPPEEVVNDCHQIYLETLRKLFDENKARFGDENASLIFI